MADVSNGGQMAIVNGAKSGGPAGVVPREKGEVSVLRRNVMTWVIDEEYERAVGELKSFLQRDFEYPEYNKRVERYISHCVGLVHAIRAKRRFPGVKSLTMAKQQELKEKFHQHFEELQDMMGKIEKVHADLKINDIRSTVIVVKTAMNAAILVVAVAFILQLTRGNFKIALAVIDDTLRSAIDGIFSFL